MLYLNLKQEHEQRHSRHLHVGKHPREDLMTLDDDTLTIALSALMYVGI